MSRYTKKIYNRVGMVRVELYKDGGEFQSIWFMNSFNTIKGLERAFKKAHKWADEIIEVCQEHEHGV